MLFKDIILSEVNLGETNSCSSEVVFSDQWRSFLPWLSLYTTYTTQYNLVFFYSACCSQYILEAKF